LCSITTLDLVSTFTSIVTEETEVKHFLESSNSPGFGQSDEMKKLICKKGECMR
jgi:hypothetical protein